MKRATGLLTAVVMLLLALTVMGSQVQAADDPAVTVAEMAVEAQEIWLDTPVWVEIQADEEAWFRFVPERSGTYTFYSEGDCDTVGTILDSEGYELAYSDDDGGDLDFKVSCWMEAGEVYLLQVRVWDQEASAEGFYVSVTERNEQEIWLDDPVWVELEEDGQAWFQFVPEKTGVYVFSSQGDMDTRGAVYDSGENLLDSNDDSGQDYNFAIFCHMEAGETYLLEAELYFGDAAGGFYVTLSESRVADVQVHPVTLNGYLDGYLENDGYYDENGEWVEGDTWFRYETVPEMITVSFADGTSEEYSVYEADEALGLTIYYWDDQCSDSAWQPGVHTAMAQVAGLTVEYQVTVREPVVDALGVENVMVYEGVDGYEDAGTFIYTYDPAFFVILNDGTQIHSQDGCVQIEGKYYYLYWMDEQYDEPWGLGEHEVEAWIGAYETSFTVTVVGASDRLEAPQILSCYSRQQTSVKVTWTTVDGADGYELWRSETPDDPDSWQRVKSILDGDTDRYTNQGLTEGVTYYYMVRAFVVDGDGQRICSEFSDADHMPAAVVFDGPYSNATFRIRLRWEEVGGCHGYQIWRQAEDGSWSVVKTLGDRGNVLTNDQGSTTAYSNTGLEAGKDYTYRMRAFYITEDGRKVFGAWSDEITVAVMPEAPVVTVSAGTGRAQLSWDEISGAEGYQIWMSTSEEGGYQIVKSVTDGSVTDYTKYGLESGKVYYFKIRSYVEVDGRKTFGGWSETVAVVIG
ncbi:MAG: fibronectin type III domain-containing protein [Oscillospiraceae bacterium]|nr:fibronectin type III domain-containing protein [Oscillospiraceae bacterium]